MAITTVDGALAGMQPPRFFYKAATPTLVIGKPQSLWGLGGNPGAGAFSTSLPGANLTAPVNGQIPFINPGSGNSYLARLLAGYTAGGSLLLCDRLWHNGGFTAVTTAQTIGSPTWPARDNAGTTNGDGVLLALEYNATGAANNPTVTVSYTNQAGTSGQSGTNSFAVSSSPAAGSFIPIGLAAGDTGAQAVASCTLSIAPTAGTCNLVAYRVLAALNCGPNFLSADIDLLTGGFPQIFNGTVPFLVMMPAATGPSTCIGEFLVSQG